MVERQDLSRRRTPQVADAAQAVEWGRLPTAADRSEPVERRTPTVVEQLEASLEHERAKVHAFPASLLDRLRTPVFSCLLGAAGTGKTTLLRQWEQEAEGGLAICATTGIAAVNVGGTTINSYLKYFDTPSLLDMYTAGYLTSKLRKLRRAGLRRLVIDEVSMLDGNQLTCLVRAVNEVNGAEGFDLEEASDEDADLPPLGLTLVGDFCQLSPVKAPFAFQSPEWGAFEGHTVTLDKVWRQTDQPFLDALKALRRGNASAALDVLASAFELKTDMDFDGPTLLAKNDAVERYNGLRMDQLTTPVERFKSHRWGDNQPSEWKQIPEELQLKEGAKVMVLANSYDQDEDRYRYVNGDLGTFVGTTPDGKCEVDIKRTGRRESVVAVTREQKAPLEDVDKEEKAALKLQGMVKGKYRIVGEITYMPLRVAYATTIHKCVAADTRVPVHGKGYIPIDQLRLTDVTPWGQIRNRVRTTQWAFRITTRRGYSVVCSADHRWSTRNGWKETRELSVGEDDIELQPGLPFPGNDSFGPTKAWALGALVGDGCYTDQRDGSVHFACSHFVFGEIFSRAMVEAFDVCPHWRSDRRGLHWTSKKHRNELFILGLDFVKAPEKSVPPLIWTLGPRDRGAFLQGLFDTDGHLGRNRVILTTASERLAREVQELLLTLGIVSKRTCYPGVKDSSYWQIFIGAESLDRYQRFVGFRHPDKAAKMRTTRPNRVLRPTNGYDRIVEVRSLAEEWPMVDIELDAPHTVAFGPFIGHNSQGLSLDAVQINLREHFVGSPGMLYVAVSRARTVGGLRLVGTPQTLVARCQADKRVAEYF